MKQSTSFAQVATNLLNVLQGYSKTIRLLLVMFLTLTVSAEVWGADFEKYSGAITEGDYLIVYSNGAMKNTVSGDRLEYTTVTVSNDKISNPDASLIWHIASSGNYWTIYNANVNKYAAGTGAKNKAQLLTTGTDDKCLWTVSGTSTYEFVNKANKAASVNSNLRRNSTYGFACYSTSTGGALTLYKKVATNFSITAQSNNINYGTVSLSGTTITASPKTGYRVSTTTPYTISPSGSATVTQSENKFTVTPTANCTITINFEAIPKYTVTLVPCSGSVSSTTLTESSAGAGVTLPTPTLDCGDWEFAGWTTSSVATETTSKPSTLLTGKYNPTANITLYAVYQRTEETEGSNEESKTITLSPPTTTSGYKEGTKTDSEGNTWSYYAAINNQSGTLCFGLNSNSLNYNIGSPAFDGKVSSVSFKAWNGSSSETRKFLFCSTNTIAQPTKGDLAEVSIPKSQQFTETYTADLSQSNVSQFYIYAPKALGITAISVTYTTSGSGSTIYYHSTPECAAPCTDPGLAYAIASVTKTVGDAAFTNLLTNNKNVSVTYTSTNTSVATVAGNGQVTILAAGTTTIKATWAGNADYCADEASYTLTVLPKTYTITVANNISNGSVSADKSSAVEGATVTLTATPAAGYKFGAWDVKDASSNAVTVTDNKFTMPASNVTVSATFVSLPKLATPSELSATEIKPTSATLNWKWLENTYAAQLSYYYLYIKKEGDADFTGPITYTNTSCSRTNLEPNTKYIWKVQAISKDKTIVLTSEESTPSSFTTAALPTYTVSFSTGTGNPTQADIKETEGGAGIKLPVGPDPLCPDWTFAGWAEAIVTETTTEPTLFAEGTNYKPASNCTLYAVYSTTAETTGFTGYEKVTEEPEDWSGKYLLSTGTFTATGAFDATGKRGHLVRETYTPGTDKKTEWEFTLAKVDNTGYFILFPDGTWYLGYDDGTNFARSTYDPSLSVAYLWTPSTEGITNVSETTRKIQDGGSDFRPYAQKETIVYLYKRIEGVLSTSTYNSNPDCTPPSEYTITWWANGEEYYTQTAVEGTAIDVPTNSPNAATYVCDDKVFVGWVDTEIIGSTDTKPTLITEFGNITEDKNFFAVFATEEGGEETTTKVFETGEIGKNGNTITSGYVLIAQASAEEGYYQDGTGAADKRYIQVSKVDKSTPMMLSNPSSVVIKANLGGGSTRKLANPVCAVWLDVNGNEMGNAVIVTDEITNKTGSDFIVSLPVANATEAYGIRVYHQKESGYNVRYYGISLSYTYNTTTYSGYVTTCEAATEALSGTFSVGKYEVAQFATGNLQYKPSTDTWRFAKQQYQVVGEDNINVGDPNYKGWIDMLGWSTNDENNNYGVNPSCNKDLYTGDFKDWGTKMGEGWLTLSDSQWDYLLNKRPNYSKLKQIAMVGEIRGIMLFPDDWTETTVDATDDAELGVKVYKYNLTQWTALEAAGAVFLPAAGRRFGGYGNTYGVDGLTDKGEEYKIQYKTNYFACYWTSTKHSDGEKVSYLFNYAVNGSSYKYSNLNLGWYEYGHAGHSVRLAKVTSTLIEIGGGDNSDVITANEGKVVNVKVNRTFKANDGYYTLCLPFDLAAEKIGNVLQISSITENVAEQGMNVVFAPVEILEAGQPYLLLPSKNIENPIFEGVTIVNTTGETTEPVSGAGINITFTGIINGVGEQTNGTTHYYVGNKGYLYNKPTAKLGLRAFFTITDAAGQEVKNIRARVVTREDAATGFENITNSENTTIKVIENGQLIIIRNGEKFNAQGQKL